MRHWGGIDHTYNKSGWVEAIVRLGNDGKSIAEKHKEIYNWIKNHIEKHERHTKTTLVLDTDDEYVLFKIKFRYERDYEWFHLAWK